MNQFSELRTIYENELFNNVIPFWEKHSPDKKHGGYFNNLDHDGAVFDTNKHIWLQGRQAWMFSKLYREFDKKDSWLTLAKSGIDFIRNNAKRSDSRVFFCLNQEGKPVKLQRKIYSECFYIMALSEFSRASGDASCLKEAKDLFKKVWEWSLDLSKVGQEPLDGNIESQTLAIPMILLNLIEEITDGDFSEYETEISNCIDRMKLHVNTDNKHVYENVMPNGNLIDSPEGRLLNPGHAIEAGWFLQHWAKKLNDSNLSKLAINMVRWSFDTGWDKEHGGLFYFLDSKGFTPTQLEWPMKLWWPHCESLYAHLLNYSITSDKSDLDAFNKVHEYTFKHFPDKKHGEWFGYLNRTGEVTHQFKGGPYKGCFHVPRALYMCLNLLKELEKRG